MKPLALCLPLSVALLTSCGPRLAETPVIVETPIVMQAPPALRTCAGDPAVPAGDDPHGIGRYIVELDAALEDCQATLAERNAWEDAAARAAAP